VSAAPQSSHLDDLIRSYQIVSRIPCFIDGLDWLVINEEQREAKRRKEVREAMKTTLWLTADSHRLLFLEVGTVWSKRRESLLGLEDCSCRSWLGNLLFLLKINDHSSLLRLKNRECHP
jgi:hypothetical protein